MININKRTVLLISIIALVGIIIILSGQCYIYYKDAQTYRALNLVYQQNEAILDFTKLFVTKVIKATTDVSFEDRLQLESAVRGTNNKEIIDQWKKFTEAGSEIQAREEVKVLLDLLINRIRY